MKGDIEYFGVIKKEKTLKNVAFLFCDTKGVINDISASAILILGLNSENISLNFINVNQIVPDFLDNISLYENKAGYPL